MVNFHITPRWLTTALALLLAAMPGRAPGQPPPAPAPPTAPASATAAASLYIAGEPSPPSAMNDGTTITGRETEKIREIMARSATPYTLELLPWKRAYTLVQSRPAMCVYSMSRTPEREALFKWVGPTDEAEWVFYGRINHRFTLKTLEDARPLRIGTYSGDARDTFLRSRGFQLDAVQDDLINPKKLLMNRIDLWAVSLRVGSNPLASYDWADKVAPLLVFNRVQVYLACNLAVPDAHIARMNAALVTMRRDGTFNKINKKYEHWSQPK